MSHSPEPWRIDAGNDLRDAEDRFLEHQSSSDGFGEWFGLSRRDMRRVVACVNALAGIPTEILEAGVFTGNYDSERDGMCLGVFVLVPKEET